MKQNTYPAEMAVLGGLILNPNLFDETQLQPYHFAGYTKVSETVWQMYGEGLEIDAMSVAAVCERNGVCRSETIFNLAGSYVPQSFTQHCEQVESAWHSRMEIEIHERALRLLKQGRPVDEVLGQVAAERETMEGEGRDEKQTRVDLVNAAMDSWIKAGTTTAPRYTRTWEPLDKLIFGIGVPKRLVIIAARPGMGKTTVMWDAAIKAAEQLKAAQELNPTAKPKGVVFFSLEMDFEELLGKYVQRETGISAEDLVMGRLTETDKAKMREAAARFYDLPIFVEDSVVELAEIKKLLRRYKNKLGCEIAFIDYLQLIANSAQKFVNSEQRVAGISRELKNITSTAGIDIIAGSQLSRAVETRGGDKRPQLSDLRESGAIEQDASVIIFIYVPSYYGIMEDDEGNSLKGVTLLIVAKNRRNNRGNGDVVLHYSTTHDRYNAEPIDEQPAPTYNALITTSAKAGDDDIPF